MDVSYLLTITISLLFLPLVISQCNDPNCMDCNSGGANCIQCAQGFIAKNKACDSCKDGWFWPQCEHNCSHCENGSCNLYNCTTGCRDGYVQETKGDYSYCQPCPKFCIKCNSTTFCTECTPGYINKSDKNTSVSTCTKCSLGVQNCANCHYDKNQTVCESCEEGYVFTGNKCVKCKYPNCQNGCYANSSCIGGCKPGYKGPTCDSKCKQGCKTCNNNECLSCNGDFYTKECNRHCNSTCRSGNNTRCRFEDGYCMNGCNEGSWGDSCEYNCSDKCFQSSSDSGRCHTNGSCIHGCVTGYTGPNCSQVNTETVSSSQISSISTIRVSSLITTMVAPTDKTSHTSPTSATTSSATTSSETTTTTTNVITTRPPAEVTSKTKQADTQVPLAAIVGGVSGGAVLIIVAVVVICLMKRKRNGNNGTTAERKVEFNPTFDPEIVNAEPSRQSSTQTVDKKKKQETNKELISDPQSKANSSTEIKINEKDVGGKAGIDGAAILEDLDDGEAFNISDETNTKFNDTYYNIEGLKRSKIHVSKLLDYILQKSDCQSEFERLPKTLTRSCNEALKPQNRAKNRYNGIYSYDATRVVLGSKEYINASHIEGYNNSKAYIASLGPTKSTMPQFAVFWEMVWQENTQKIVMLTNLMENGKMKCDQYWPDNGSSREYGSVSVTAKAERVYAEFVVRELLVVKKRETRAVTHYHFIAWPDKSVPDTVVSLLEFRKMVEKKRAPQAGPVIVHCSAGIGRTGTYIALDMLIREGKAEDSVDIFGCVNALRGQRFHMVQTAEQYGFLHHCVVYALTCQPDALDVSYLTSLKTGDRMNDQFQAFTNLLPLLTNKESDAIAANSKRKENRKGSDIPGNHHRVKLTGVKNDYINAVFVDGYQQKDRYILAQTPMPSTLEDFVSLLYQEKVGLVVCLDEENTKDKTIGQYIQPANKIAKFGHFHLSADSSDSNDGFVARTLTISKNGTSSTDDVKIQHYQFQGCKNRNSVPESLQMFMSLISALPKHCRPESGTVLIHCLDGAKKSGLLCAVAIMLEKLAVDRDLSVINTICQVRSRRRTAIQDFEQFQFCYSCVREHLETSEAKTYYSIL